MAGQNKSTSCMFSLKPGGKRILWEITDRCNAYCKHCSTRATETGTKELSTEELKRAFSEASGVGFNQLYITGGEPFLREDIFELIDFGKESFRDIMLSTNGSFIDENIADRVAKSGIGYTLISLDSIDPNKHDEFRNMKGLYQKACESVKILSSKGIHVTINSVITSNNYSSLENVVKLADSLNASSLLLSPFLPIGRGADNKELLITSEQFRSVEEEIEIIKNDYSGLKIKYKRSREENAPLEVCPGGRDYVTITSDGRMLPCPWLYEFSQFITLSTLQGSSFQEVYRSKEINLFNDLVDERIQKQDCGLCEIKECGHGCLALAQIYEGNHMQFDPFCKTNKEK